MEMICNLIIPRTSFTGILALWAISVKVSCRWFAGRVKVICKYNRAQIDHEAVCVQGQDFFFTCCNEALITGVPMNWSNYHIYQGCQTHFCVSLSGPLWLWILWNCVNVWHLWYIYEFTLVHSCLSGWKVSLPNFWRIAIVSLINRVMRQTERSVIQQGCERNKGRTVRWNLSIRYFICSRTVREAT